MARPGWVAFRSNKCGLGLLVAPGLNPEVKIIHRPVLNSESIKAMTRGIGGYAFGPGDNRVVKEILHYFEGLSVPLSKRVGKGRWHLAS